jgi:hypothetical protein
MLVLETLGLSYLLVIVAWVVWNIFIRTPKEMYRVLYEDNQSTSSQMEYLRELSLWQDSTETNDLKLWLNQHYISHVSDTEERRGEAEALYQGKPWPPLSDNKKRWVKAQLKNRQQFLHRFSREWIGEDFDT